LATKKQNFFLLFKIFRKFSPSGLLLSVSKSGIRFINAVTDTTENPENYWPSQEEIKKAIERCRKIQNFLPDVEAIVESKISSQKIPDSQQLKLFD